MKQWVWLSPLLFSIFRLVSIYLNWTAQGVYRLWGRCFLSLLSPVVQSKQHLSVDLALISTHEGGEGSSYGLRSTKHLISMNRDGPWGRGLLQSDLLRLSPALNVLFVWLQGRVRKDFWSATIKEGCCEFKEADGVAHQKCAWETNKLFDLEADTRRVSTASSRIWSKQMLAVTYLRPSNKCLFLFTWPLIL